MHHSLHVLCLIISIVISILSSWYIYSCLPWPRVSSCTLRCTHTHALYNCIFFVQRYVDNVTPLVSSMHSTSIIAYSMYILTFIMSHHWFHASSFDGVDHVEALSKIGMKMSQKNSITTYNNQVFCSKRVAFTLSTLLIMYFFNLYVSNAAFCATIAICLEQRGGQCEVTL